MAREGAARPPGRLRAERGRRRTARARGRQDRRAARGRREGDLPTLVTALGEAGTPRHRPPARTPCRASPSSSSGWPSIEPSSACSRRRRRCSRSLTGPLDGDLEAALERAALAARELPRASPAALRHHDRPDEARGSAARTVMPGRASVECDCRVVPGTAETELEAEFRRALGDDLPFEPEFLEEPVGGHRLAPRDAARGGLPELPRQSRRGSDAPPDDVHRVHRLALHARVPGHSRLRLLAVPPHAERGLRERVPQP